MRTPRDARKTAYPLRFKEYAKRQDYSTSWIDIILNPGLSWELQEAGVPCKGPFLWELAPMGPDRKPFWYLSIQLGNPILLDEIPFEGNTFGLEFHGYNREIRGFSSDELNYLLPATVNVPYKNGSPQFYRRHEYPRGKAYEVCYYATSQRNRMWVGPTEVLARAEALLWVAENARFESPYGSPITPIRESKP